MPIQIPRVRLVDVPPHPAIRHYEEVRIGRLKIDEDPKRGRVLSVKSASAGVSAGSGTQGRPGGYSRGSCAAASRGSGCLVAIPPSCSRLPTAFPGRGA